MQTLTTFEPLRPWRSHPRETVGAAILGAIGLIALAVTSDAMPLMPQFARQAELAQSLAHTRQQIADSAWWPEVVFQGNLEADRQNFSSKGGAYWFTAVTLRWTLWNGGETKARQQQARFAQTRAEALRRRSDSAIQLEVRKAYLDLGTAAQRIEAASAASAEAEEAYRIIQNRHQSGLTVSLAGRG